MQVNYRSTFADIEYEFLVISLRTNLFQFKYPYTLSHYRHGLNPMCSLYEELQVAIFKPSKNKFDRWIINRCVEMKGDIITALKNDCSQISRYLLLYESEFLNNLLHKFESYLVFFNRFYT